MKYSQLIEFAKKYLMENNISDYDIDAYLLLEYVFGMTKMDYFMKMNEIIDDEEKLNQYKKYLEVRAAGKPLQYITGIQDFMGLTFKVSEAVLIPRYDTEILVDKVLRKIKEYPKNNLELRICDMCTGSGCIGISIAKLGKTTDVTCVDISKDALEVAKKNAVSNGVEYIKFVQSDLFSQLEENVKFDFIVSNPPYIKTAEIDGLMKEVRMFEPTLALDGDIDGLKFYNIITKEAASRLHNGGWLMYEIGCEQGVEVSELMKAAGFVDVEVIKDLAGLDRVVIGRAHKKS